MLPEIGDLPLAEVRARHVVDLFHKLRTDRERNLAQRTIYNIYTVVAALFRDAKLADLIEQTPCILDERQLGLLVDKDPEWRNAAVFACDEVETIISDARIPADRQRSTRSSSSPACAPGKPRRCAGATTIAIGAPTSSAAVAAFAVRAGQLGDYRGARPAVGVGDSPFLVVGPGNSPSQSLRVQVEPRRTRVPPDRCSWRSTCRCLRSI